VARVKWEVAPDAQDYPAASSYLSLLVTDAALRDELVKQFHAAPIVHYKAKDLLRASQLPLLPADNFHVAADLQKVRKRQPLSPVLLVGGDLVRGFPLQIADGYHRVCASYHVMENTDIPCRLIDLPTARPAVTPAVTPAAVRPVKRAAAKKVATAADATVDPAAE
jgi:hypothetical protein